MKHCGKIKNSQIDPDGTPRIGSTGCEHHEARNHPGIMKALKGVFNGEPHPVFFRVK
jgi:hypothetical protein